RADVVAGARSLARRVAAGDLRPQDVDDAALADSLATARFADPDVVVRTGRETRLSNFMLYQCAESTLVFLDEYWPDVTPADLNRALADHRRALPTDAAAACGA